MSFPIGKFSKIYYFLFINEYIFCYRSPFSANKYRFIQQNSDSRLFADKISHRFFFRLYENTY